MLFDEALAYLLSLGHETLTIKLGLTNTERLLSALGNPHKSFSSVQIAGTNGKGSTAMMLDSICRAAGIRTGLFTSPHLITITQRIRIDGRRIGQMDFARLAAHVKTIAAQLVKEGRLSTLPTFFEHVTAIALLAFREAKIDLAILETGLGGRLDSTSVAQADIVAITQIAMDHQEYLGSTLTDIAREKAAIIRPGVEAIISPQNDEALKVIEHQSQVAGVVPRFIKDTDIQVANVSSDGHFGINLKTNSDVYEGLQIGFRGRHQMTNAAIAVSLAEALRNRGHAISRAAIIQGIESATHHPGRLESWGTTSPILFDGAHNPAAAAALRAYLDEFVHEPITIVFGAMSDKAVGEMISILFSAAHAIVLVEIDNPRAAAIGMLRAAIPENFDRSIVREATSLLEALRLAVEETPPKGVVCVTGSLYLVGAVQDLIRRTGLSAHRGNT